MPVELDVKEGWIGGRSRMATWWLKMASCKIKICAEILVERSKLEVAKIEFLRRIFSHQRK